MGEDALKFGPLADLELLASLLEDTAHLLEGMSGDLEEAKLSTEERQQRNAELKARLHQMKKDMGNQMGNLMGKMMSIFGQDPSELLTEEQIEKVLNSTFKKFDKDGSGELELPEFIKAWRFLDLKGDEEEIINSFKGVDVDNSGIVERREFVDAIKGARMAELSLSVLMTQMDGQLEGLEDIFSDYKRKQEEARLQAASDLEASKGAYAKFKATAKRRRLMKKAYEEKIANKTHELVKQLREIAGETAVEDEGSEMYKTLKDTFNAFDNDGSAELGFPEYVEAWKFLGLQGSSEEIKKAFDSVDVDGSSVVDWDEFCFSIMGEKATKYGVLADMEDLQRLLANTVGEYNILRDTLQEVRANNDVRADRNAKLRRRMDSMKSEVSAQMNGLISDLLGVDPRDVLTDEEINKHLTTAFNKFDEDNSGEMGNWEFTQAWLFLGLKGTESEINDAFTNVDKNNSGLIDLNEFITAIKSERLLELNLTRVFDKVKC